MSITIFVLEHLNKFRFDLAFSYVFLCVFAGTPSFTNSFPQRRKVRKELVSSFQESFISI
jgi:hypothetical protein